MPLVLSGATSGSATLQSTDATTTTITLPGTTSTLYGNAGTVITSGTAVASTSGTSIDFTSIPSWVKRITVMFNGVSTNGTSNVLIQVGAGSVTTSGYTSNAGSISGVNATASGTASTGFVIVDSVVAASAISGSIVLTNLSTNIWTENGIVTKSANLTSMSAGLISLSGTLDRIRMTTVNGTDTFDAGSINIQYE